jgi:hypothetical protein
MPTRPCLSLLPLAASLLFAHPAHATDSSGDVKVCVRIDEKSWSRDGTAARAPSTAADAPPPVGAGASAATAAPAKQPARGDTASDSSSGGRPAGSAPAEPPAGAPLPDDRPVPFAIVPAAHAEFATSAQESGVDPVLYLKRLLEYHVTHAPGFESVEKGCTETLVVELYSVKHGWTAFARFSKNAREEKVDVVRMDELGVFAERVASALLRDKSISETLTRTTVLRADSDEHVRQVRTRAHFLLGMGSGLRIGELPTAPNATAAATNRVRVETPLGFVIGVRNKFRGFALDATSRLEVGVGERASRLSLGGGHVDYSVGLGAGLDFLAYADPDAVNTLYYGGGGSFEVSRYQSQGARAQDGSQPEPGGLWGGGVSIDLVLGCEFARTSTLHFFVEGSAGIPAYLFRAQNSQAAINAYVPSTNFRLGLLL